MWAVGCITVVLLTGTPAFSDPTTGEYSSDLANSCNLAPLERSQPWKEVRSRPKQFVMKLLQLNEAGRMSAEEALRDPWFSNDFHATNFEELYQRTIRHWRARSPKHPPIEFLDSRYVAGLTCSQNAFSSGLKIKDQRGERKKPPPRDPDSAIRPFPKNIHTLLFPRRKRPRSSESDGEASSRTLRSSPLPQPLTSVSQSDPDPLSESKGPEDTGPGDRWSTTLYNPEIEYCAVGLPKESLQRSSRPETKEGPHKSDTGSMRHRAASEPCPDSSGPFTLEAKQKNNAKHENVFDLASPFFQSEKPCRNDIQSGTLDQASAANNTTKPGLRAMGYDRLALDQISEHGSVEDLLPTDDQVEQRSIEEHLNEIANIKATSTPRTMSPVIPQNLVWGPSDRHTAHPREPLSSSRKQSAAREGNPMVRLKSLSQLGYDHSNQRNNLGPKPRKRHRGPGMFDISEDEDEKGEKAAGKPNGGIRVTELPKRQRLALVPMSTTASPPDNQEGTMQTGASRNADTQRVHGSSANNKPAGGRVYLPR